MEVVCIAWLTGMAYAVAMVWLRGFWHVVEVFAMAWRIGCRLRDCRHGVARRLSASHGMEVAGIAWHGGCWHGMEVVAMSWFMLLPWRGV